MIKPLKNKDFLFEILPLSYYHQNDGVVVACVLPKDAFKVLRFLRDSSLTKCEILSAISVVDYPERINRFEVVYELLSIRLNYRFRLKTVVNENTALESIASLYPCSNWWEREAWDLFGVFFKNHPDLRRILSDYGFEGHPLRKDFPLSGYIDLRYDENVKRVVFEPLTQDQSFRVFNYTSL
jgi:NADH-quinone oxidoreductase subunit C